MPHILVLGYGNPLRCDDGFGWQLARRLQSEFHHPDVRVIACHQLTPELADALRGAQYVIFADATSEPGASALSLAKLRAGETASPDFTHQLDPQTLVMLTRTLYGAAPCAAFLLKAKAYDLGYGKELSPEMAGTLDKAFARVVSLCEFLAPTPQQPAFAFVPHNS